MAETLHTCLKERTRDYHLLLEKTFIGRIQGIQTELDYAGFLNDLFLFHRAVESAAFGYLGELKPAFSMRDRSRHLDADIFELTQQHPKGVDCPVCPKINSFPSALGALYVLEGSTLGGQIVAKMISRKFPGGRGLRFFNGYGAETDGMWETFKSYLKVFLSDRERHEVIEAATNTFVTFNLWLRRHE